MKITTWICAALLAVAASTPALAWEYQGHQMVGAIADRILTDDPTYANARKNVQEILGFTLQVAAPWPDCVRSVVHKDDGKFSYLPSPLHPSYRVPCKSFETEVGSREPSEPSTEQLRMEDYVRRNWSNCTYIVGVPGLCHQAFHFADVAIQRDGYDRKYVGTSDHDVVSAINACIAVLQGQPAPDPFKIKDKKEALFLLAHFVGDIHQPLHVGAVYLDKDGKLVDPDATKLDADTETHGGNSIQDGDHNLHAAWDDIPAAWGVTPDADMLEKARALQPTPGPIIGWAAIWATETFKQAQTAFTGLTFSNKAANHWHVHFPDKLTYQENANKVKRTQLAHGGARLAHVLKIIWP